MLYAEGSIQHDEVTNVIYLPKLRTIAYVRFIRGMVGYRLLLAENFTQNATLERRVPLFVIYISTAFNVRNPSPSVCRGVRARQC